MSDDQRVEVGQVYETWSAAPGHPPMRWRVSGMGDQGWCWVRHLHSPTAGESPMRQSTLLTPKLYHRIEATDD